MSKLNCQGVHYGQDVKLCYVQKLHIFELGQTSVRALQTPLHLAMVCKWL